MITIEEFRDNPSEHIYLNGKGRIVEDNIDVNEEGEEVISYEEAIKDYLKSKNV